MFVCVFKEVEVKFVSLRSTEKNHGHSVGIFKCDVKKCERAEACERHRQTPEC